MRILTHGATSPRLIHGWMNSFPASRVVNEWDVALSWKDIRKRHQIRAGSHFPDGSFSLLDVRLPDCPYAVISYADGDYDWSRPIAFGTASADYVENCTFTMDSNISYFDTLTTRSGSSDLIPAGYRQALDAFLMWSIGLLTRAALWGGAIASIPGLCSFGWGGAGLWSGICA